MIADQRMIFTCPICGGGGAEVISVADVDPYFQGWCRTCTNLWVTHTAVDLIKRVGKVHLFTAYLQDLPLAEFREIGCVAASDVERLADSVSSVPLVEQFDRLLSIICERSASFGAAAVFSYDTDWPQIRAKNYNEVLAMVRTLKSEGYLVGDGPGGILVPPTATRKAFERYAELLQAGPMSQQAFVAMAFAAEFDGAWTKIIKPGIIAAKYRPFRVDQKEHSEKVDDLIMAEIRRSKFLVADFSGQRGGVYFEAGFAYGLGRPVIWMCREEEVGKLHFDTRQYNHILYSDPLDAQRKLRNRIVAILGEGTYTPPVPVTLR